MTTKFVAILFVLEFALAQTSESAPPSETENNNTVNLRDLENEPNGSLKTEHSKNTHLNPRSKESTDGITTTSVLKEPATRFLSTQATLTEAHTAAYGFDKDSNLGDFIPKELQNSSANYDDPRNDFIRFVETAIKKSINMKQSPMKDQIAPLVVRKLITITRQLRKQNSVEKSISEKTSSQTIAQNLNLKDFSRHADYNERIHTEKPEDFERNLHKSSHKDISQSSLSSPTRSSEHQNQNGQKLGNEEFHRHFRNTKSVPVSRRLPFSSRYNLTTKTSSPRRLGQLQGQFQRGSNRNKNQYSEAGAREYKVHPLMNSIALQVPRKTKKENNRVDFDSNESGRQKENARYSFASDVQDDINGNLHRRQETRDGTRVTGSYTYEDGFFRRTVHYVADEKGYRVVKQEVEEIGNGPLYNPYGSAKIHSYVAGKNLNYQISASDLIGSPQVSNVQPKHNQDRGYEWDYQ